MRAPSLEPAADALPRPPRRADKTIKLWKIYQKRTYRRPAMRDEASLRRGVIPKIAASQARPSVHHAGAGDCADARLSQTQRPSSPQTTCASTCGTWSAPASVSVRAARPHACVGSSHS